MTRDARTERRAKLSRERIVAAGIELADRDGIAKLSMRRLAHELGVEAMSLYHHVPSKDALLGEMMDAVYAEMELPSETADWRSDIRCCAVSVRDTLLRHTWATELIGQPTRPSPPRVRWMDAVLGRLRRAGFDPNMTHHAYHAIDSHVTGFVLWVLPYVRISREQPDLAQRFLATVDVAAFPYLVEHIAQHADDRPGDTSEFEFGLDLLLDGLERLRRSA